MPKLVRDLNQVLGPTPQAGRVYRTQDGVRPAPQDEIDATARRRRPPAEPQGLGGFVGDVVVGALQGAGDMVGGTFHMITHPIETVKGLAMLPIALVTRPGEVVRAFTEPYAEAIREGRPGRAIGRGMFEIGSMMLGSGALKPASGAIGASQAATGAARTGQAAQQVGQVARKAKQAATAAQKAQEVGEIAQKARLAATAAPVNQAMQQAAKARKVTLAAQKAQEVGELAQKARLAATAAPVNQAMQQAAKARKVTLAAQKAQEVGELAQKARLAATAAPVNQAMQQAAKARKVAAAAPTAAQTVTQGAHATTRTVRVTAGARSVRTLAAPPALREVARSTRHVRVIDQKVVAGFLTENRTMRVSKVSQVLATPGGGLLELSRTTAHKVHTVMTHPDAAALLRMAARIPG
ncbi:MAG: hypothetical protein VKO21_03695 [Candidatus Sericytochromatia bacterium]|nr:hypothetical protein [Candidatus Sericytochromatia bacterium]